MCGSLPAGVRAMPTDRSSAAELVAIAPDVILATSSPALAASQHATRTVPIVFTSVVDPVGGGFVDSSGAAGRKHHRICAVRIRPEREMAGAAQGDRTRRDASGRPSRCCHHKDRRPASRLQFRPWRLR